jgi:hypothetical protein
VSEHQAEQTSSEPGSLNAGPAAPPSSDTELATASAQDAPKAEAPKAEAPKPEAPKPEASKPEAPKPEAPKPEAPKSDASKSEASKSGAPKPDAPAANAPGTPGKHRVMSAGGPGSDMRDDAGPQAKSAQAQGMFGKRRFAALAAVVALAMMAGALGGALATGSLGRFYRDDAARAGNRTLEAAAARILADITNLKVSVERISKTGMSQFNGASDRLDKLEKAQAEPAAKLAELGEAVEKLRAAPPVVPAAAPAPIVPVATAPAPVAPKEVTGSTARPVLTMAEASKADVGRLPTVEGWVLRDVASGVALVENRRGKYEVYAGDPIPGLGRVEAIRRQDGRWIVVTSKGLIVGR